MALASLSHWQRICRAIANFAFYMLSPLSAQHRVAILVRLRHLFVHSSYAVRDMLTAWDGWGHTRPGEPLHVGTAFLDTLLSVNERTNFGICGGARTLLFQTNEGRRLLLRTIVRYAAHSAQSRTKCRVFLQQALDSPDLGILCHQRPVVRAIFQTLASITPPKKLATTPSDRFSLVRFMAWEELEPMDAVELLASLLSSESPLSDTVIGDGIARIARDSRCQEQMKALEEKFQSSLAGIRRLRESRVRLLAATVLLQTFPRWVEAAAFALEESFSGLTIENAHERYLPIYELIVIGGERRTRAVCELVEDLSLAFKSKRSVEFLSGLVTAATFRDYRGHFGVVARLVLEDLPRTFISQHITRLGSPPQSVKPEDWKKLVAELHEQAITHLLRPVEFGESPSSP